MNSEQYADFPDPRFNVIFKVSNYGNVINIRNNTVSKNYTFKNYTCIRINNSTFRVCDLVAKCFIDNSGQFLRHIDGDKSNNMRTNLVYKNIEDHLEDIYGEKWKPIKDFNDYYVSTTGKVWSLFSENILCPQMSYGYHRINIGGKKNSKKMFVHRLVATAFLVNNNNYQLVNHKNGIKTDCSVDNLEWCNHSENSIHSINVLGNRNFNTHSKKKCDKPDDSIEFTEGYYITKDGQIYSEKNSKFLIPYLRPDGYTCVQIRKKRAKIHRLVAQSFLPIPPIEKIFVNHKNLNRSDNRVENLEWVTPSENTKHAVDNDPNRYVKQQIKVACIDKETDEIIQIYDSLAKASEDRGIKCSGNISNVCRGQGNTTGGYKWKYI